MGSFAGSKLVGVKSTLKTKPALALRTFYSEAANFTALKKSEKVHLTSSFPLVMLLLLTLV